MLGKYCLQMLRGSVRRTYTSCTTYVCVFPSALSWAFSPRSRDVRVDHNNVPAWWSGRCGLWLFLLPAEVSTAGFCELSHVRIWVTMIVCRSMRRFVRAWVSPYTSGWLLGWSWSTYPVLCDYIFLNNWIGVRSTRTSLTYICMWYRPTWSHIRFQSSRWSGN